jgi:hypothetical protein|tara:strand:- start:6 stop:167 length:162 start_codon:yes stop_codon:yes gene_type:complete
MYDKGKPITKVRNVISELSTMVLKNNFRYILSFDSSDSIFPLENFLLKSNAAR